MTDQRSLPPASTGLASLDEVLGGLRVGDNVVWRVDEIDCYRPFVERFVSRARDVGQRITYFRFGRHEPVLTERTATQVCFVDPDLGFEHFITQIHNTIRDIGVGAGYVFDALSDLSATRYSDRMIGTFFQLTCPYLRSLDTVAYFAFYRGRHSYHATLPIQRTTQLMLDVYRYRGRLYLQPSKARSRPLPAAPYRLCSDSLEQVTDSGEIAGALAASPWTGLPSAGYRMIGIWDKTFLHAEVLQEASESGEVGSWDADKTKAELLRLIIPREQRMLALANRYLDLGDALYVWKRMIGTGMIGGKSVGMLLARAILARRRPDLHAMLEPHDSFFIGSDVYYTFLVMNDCWWKRRRDSDPASVDGGLEEIRTRIRTGEFPPYILRRFSDLVEHFGRSPIIVRSSSLLEDAFGNAFSGKYESVFCPNQGTHDERLAAFVDAVRTVYASTLSPEALSYRARRGVLDRDEQMALLVQRVSGSEYDGIFLPQLAGVLYSFNPYAWNKHIDPRAGLLRLVLGLGTRAVDRHDDDYTRIVPLGAPQLRPDSDESEVKRYAQRRVDVIDLQANRLESVWFHDLVHRCPSLPLARLATRDRLGEREAQNAGLKRRPRWIPTFEPVLREGEPARVFREIAEAVRDGYESEVDIEITANYDSDGRFVVNILQCRPFMAGPRSDADDPTSTDVGGPTPGPTPASAGRLLVRSLGGVIGRSRRRATDGVVYVRPRAYAALRERERHAVAHAVGAVTRVLADEGVPTLLIGPGRWGSSTPSLGVPVSFSDIATVEAIVEVDTMHQGLVPDLSLGTHFFTDLVESDILYVAHFARQEGNFLDADYLESHAAGQHADPIGPATNTAVGAALHGSPHGVVVLLRRRLELIADAVEQRFEAYLSEE